MANEDEIKQFLKNEEKLWDMAALTIAPTVYQLLQHPTSLFNCPGLAEDVAIESYRLADALMAERRKRLAEPAKAPPVQN